MGTVSQSFTSNAGVYHSADRPSLAAKPQNTVPNSPRRPLAFLVTALAVAFTLAGVSFGTEYFVLPSGNDAHSGSAAALFKTIARGLFELKAGDTLTIGPGAYRESCELSVKGTENQPVLIRGAGDPAPSIEAAGEDAFVIRDSAYVTIEGLKFANARRAGVRIAASDRVAVNGCDVADNTRYGVYVTLSDHITIGQASPVVWNLSTIILRGKHDKTSRSA